MGKVVLEGVARRYGQTQALYPVDLTVEEGAFLTLVGPSGCGKSTTLRIVAGFIEPTAGKVWLDGQDVTHVPPHKRNIGMVFQDYALFPHITVAENVGFGLAERGVAKAKVKDRVEELLALVDLEGLGGRYPAHLSGGQQQRVALIRAIAHPPRVLLLDEPFAALDRKLRESMQFELRKLQRTLGITTIFVTHDRTEAMNLSDHIAVLSGGHLLQHDTPENIYSRPRNEFVASFLGDINMLRGAVIGEDASGALFRSGNLTVPTRFAADGQTAFGIRPEHVEVLPEGADTVGFQLINGRIVNSVFHGNLRRLVVDVSGDPWIVETHPDTINLDEGRDVRLGWRPSNGILLS